MKKILLLLTVLFCFSVSGYAQNYALIDMDYILENVNGYKAGQDQIETLSKKWKTEVEKGQQDVKKMYESYQSSLSSLSAAQKTQRENAIVEKEKTVQELNKKYFGPEGELSKRSEALMKPIQEAVYEAVKEIAEKGGYDLILERTSASSIIFASPNLDISNDVLAKLGYSK